MWWPGISKQIEKMVHNCPHCTRERKPRKEPLLSTSLPTYPWQKIGSDLFLLNGSTYLIVSDYFSRFPEVIKLTNTTSAGVISALKSLFARYGIPEELVSDNGPQYASQEFCDFAKQYNFQHTTSSPHFPQSNGHAERAVQTAKKLLSGSTDPRMALLSYRSTPLTWCGLSPAELLMGRPIRSNIPQPTETFIPQWPYLVQYGQLCTIFSICFEIPGHHTETLARNRHRSIPKCPSWSFISVSCCIDAGTTILDPYSSRSSLSVSIP